MRAALYIDGDSIEARYIASVCGEIRHTDDIIMKKLFINNGERNAWCDAAHRFHLNEYVSTGKSGENGNVLHMAVEVMADTAENKLERVYIVTGNGLIIPLLDKMKLLGVEAVVIGPCGVNRNLVDASDRYIYLEVINGENCTAEIPDIADIAREIFDVSSYYKGMGQNAAAEDIYNGLARRYPDFDVRNYGYSHFATFVQANVQGVVVQMDEKGRAMIEVVDERDDLERFAYEYLAEREYKIDDMNELLGALEDRFPGFTINNYGYHSEYGFILSFPKFEIWENKGIKMKRTFKLSSENNEKDDK